MQGVEQTKSDLAAQLSEARANLAGLKQQLQVVPAKLAELRAAEAELESFEQQRADKAELLECEDVAPADVQSMADCIAAADETEARGQEQRRREQAEREEQDRRDEEVRRKRQEDYA